MNANIKKMSFIKYLSIRKELYISYTLLFEFYRGYMLIEFYNNVSTSLWDRAFVKCFWFQYEIGYIMAAK